MRTVIRHLLSIVAGLAILGIVMAFAYHPAAFAVVGVGLCVYLWGWLATELLISIFRRDRG